MVSSFTADAIIQNYRRALVRACAWDTIGRRVVYPIYECGTGAWERFATEIIFDRETSNKICFQMR
jgi:hypothetical protein